MAIRYKALTLRGNTVDEGIRISGGQVPFNPRWGLVRHNPGLLAASPAPDGDVNLVHVAITEEGVVLVPCEGAPDQELVLVQQYMPGAGAKRWPWFSVAFGPEVRKLSEAATSGGSGEERWALVSAPLGWAENIARQFIDRRDYGGQKISYRPD